MTPVPQLVRGPGLHRGLPMAEYQAIDAMGSGRLEWLHVSALHYRWMLEHPPETTEAQHLGTALHMAVLEPDGPSFSLLELAAVRGVRSSPLVAEVLRQAERRAGGGGARRLRTR